jgi:branched-chain amino acid transport system permease protein
MTDWTWKHLLACTLAVLALATAPFWVSNSYYINIGSQILFWAILAQALNVLVGYAGLTSLGHAALFAMSGYTAAILLEGGTSHLTAAVAGIIMTLIVSALFAVLALRATGIGFLMITLAMGQIIWGIAYRWASLTNGDNGINMKTRPMPFGIDLMSTSAFYWTTLVVFLVAVLSMAVFVRSPFGAAVRGTRDQARRMTALGYNVWAIRFAAFLLSGFWTGIAGLLFLYYNQFISPQVAALQTSAEALLMVISGGTATVLGPLAGAAIVIIMKNVVSAYIERWNLVLGVIFVLIVSFMPEGLIPGTLRLIRQAFKGADKAPADPAAPTPVPPVPADARPPAPAAKPVQPAGTGA